MTPQGSQQVQALREAGELPAVVVDFVDDRPRFDLPRVAPRPGQRHDWQFLADCPVHLIVRPGVEIQDDLEQILRVCAWSPYPQIIDIELRRVAYVVSRDPLKLWHMGRNSQEFMEWF